jgi:glycosyltransferase involved in cell wall biosynthesis
MGFSTIEAMSCGVIPILSEHTSTSEVVPPDCGFLVPAGNPQKLAQAILKVMDNMIDIKNMQSNCVKHVRNEYEAKNTAKSYYEVYKRILEKDS